MGNRKQPIMLLVMQFIWFPYYRVPVQYLITTLLSNKGALSLTAGCVLYTLKTTILLHALHMHTLI